MKVQVIGFYCRKCKRLQKSEKECCFCCALKKVKKTHSPLFHKALQAKNWTPAYVKADP